MTDLDGTLYERIARCSRLALESGALKSIETEQEFVEDGGVRFLVRAVSSLARKDELRERELVGGEIGAALPNPFLPYEEELFVADVSATHVALLNKFNVIEHHLLIVTRAFEDQRRLLTRADFEALWTCMLEYDSLGFYNGGEEAGASQAHKHLQLVPLPMAGEGPAVPIAPLLEGAGSGGEIERVSGVPFEHVLARADPALAARPEEAAEWAWERYMAMLAAAGIEVEERGGERWQGRPYNLLVTRDWMLLVPRAREFWGSVSVNALGFAGSLFVRRREDFQAIVASGPMSVLAGVAGAR
jgi:ATP adenylyltransferase